MKNLTFAIALVLCAFASGWAGAWMANRSFETRLDDRLQFVLTHEPETRNRLSLYTLQALRAGDTERAVEMHCRMLRSSLPLMRMSKLETPARAKALRELIEESQSMISSLEESGACELKRGAP